MSTPNNNSLANVSPLGLMGFGMTTVLLNIHNAGFAPLNTTILSMGIFYGGIAQLIAGVLSFQKGSTFATTAFTSYGLFWLSLVAIFMLPASNGVATTDHSFLGIYMILWGIFTLFMFIGSFKFCKAEQFIFGTLTVLFFLLAAHLILDNKLLGIIAGYEGIICGASAIYLAMAQVLNELYEREVMPIG